METHRKILAKEQHKMAIRMCSTCRTISEETVLVISMMPVVLMAQERRKNYESNGDHDKRELANQEVMRK